MVLALCLSLLPASALAATAANGSSLTELAVTLKNDCDAAVKYSIVLGNSAAQEVTLAANESLPLKGDKGTAYSITWVEGSDPNYIYEAPDQKTLTGTIGSVATTRYYYKNSENGGECTNEVAKTISYGGYTMDTEGSVYYDVTSLVTFRRTSSVGYTYTTADTTFTARYKNATYTLTLPTVDGVSFEVDGAVEEDGVYTVTYGTNVIITMTVDETEVDVESLSYTIGNGDPVTVNDFTKPFTIAGDSITGNIIVNLTSDAIYQITVTVEGGNGTVNGSDSATLSLKEGTTAEELAAQFTFAAAPGYQVVAPVFETVTADKTYTATFTHATYPVTWPEGVEGVESATHGTDLTFTAKLEDELLLGVQYQVGDGQPVALEPNKDGSYTIPGDAIIGNITVIYTTVTGSWDYITAEFYAAAPAGEKVALLNTFKLGEGTYALDGYGDMFWSSKYSAYVCFVADSETNDTLTKKLAVSQNTVTEISYSGDINGTGTVTPADSAAINAVLHSIQVE